MKNLKEMFDEGFQHEFDLVDIIKIHLITDEQQQFLHKNNISIEDCLNGRIPLHLGKSVAEMYRDWNNKIGGKYFLDNVYAD